MKIEKEAVLPSASEVSVFPNPFRSSFTIEYTLESSTNVSMALVDMLGRPVRTLVHDQWHPEGNHRIEVQAPKLASGIYVVEVSTVDGRPSYIYLVRH